MPLVTTLTPTLFDQVIEGKVILSKKDPIAINQQQAASLIEHVEKQSLVSCLPEVLLNVSEILFNTSAALRQQPALSKRYAEQGLRCLNASEDPSILFALAKQYQHGIPEVLPADVKHYVALLQQAVVKKHKPAQLQLAEHQCNGLSVDNQELIKKAPAEAEKLLKNMSDYPDAAFALFQLYWPSEVKIPGIQKSATEAVTYLLQAANSGHRAAMFAAFQLYEAGITEQKPDGQKVEIIQKNLTQAMQWLKKAAEGQHPEATYRWGERLETGLPGVLPKNPKLALACFRQAMALGYSKAKDAMDRLDPYGFAQDIDALQQTVKVLLDRLASLETTLKTSNSPDAAEESKKTHSPSLF